MPCVHWKWTPEVDDRLKELLGTYKRARVARMLTEEFGRTYTVKSVQYRVSQLGLNAQRNAGEYTPQILADELGVYRCTVVRAMRELYIQSRRPGHFRFISLDDAERIRRHLAPPPEPAVKVCEAAERLGYTPGTIRRQVREGQVRAIHAHNGIHIPLAEIERIQRERRAG